jgi:uncharacterized protein (DUF169 family)
MTYRAAATVLTNSLNLDYPPIALAFADKDSVRAIATQPKPAASACSFWRLAESGVFYAPADAHFNCPVGAMVMGFDLPKKVSDELMELVGTMGKCGYVSAEEPGHIPTGKAKPRGIIYGPLSQFPVQPDVVLCWLSPFQAMIWNEATGGATWNGAAPGGVFGRPACAALPASINQGAPVMSLGCMGMRTFTEIPEDHLLAAVPGTKVEEFARTLQSMRATNDTMAAFYASRKKGFSSPGKKGWLGFLRG